MKVAPSVNFSITFSPLRIIRIHTVVHIVIAGGKKVMEKLVDGAEKANVTGLYVYIYVIITSIVHVFDRFELRKKKKHRRKKNLITV